ncbi:hypothetical protein Csa_023949, partial [Cucumis sativus]
FLLINLMEESYKMRMSQSGGIPMMAAALPPLPPSCLGKPTSSGEKKLPFFQYNTNLNIYGNGKSILSEGEATTSLPPKQDRSQVPDSDKDLTAEAKRLRRFRWRYT